MAQEKKPIILQVQCAKFLDSNIQKPLEQRYILLLFVLTLCQMFLRMFKSREISSFNQDKVRVSPINDIIPTLPSISMETMETPKTL